MFSYLAETFGWTPQQVGAMTPAQAVAYLPRGEGSGNETIGPQGRRLLKFKSVEEAKQYQAARKGKPCQP